VCFDLLQPAESLLCYVLLTPAICLQQFYRLPAIKTAFKRYIKAMVTRYANSPTILAWELANEARCGADGVRNLPRSPTNCSPELITAWYDEMSSYIKSLDPHHLVTTGSEGGFNIESEDWAYNGADGSDFDAELRLKNIDFGTFHSYPDWWSKTVEWTVQWVEDHGASMRQGRKPVVHEEYGEFCLRCRDFLILLLR
jgi:mannan endo-1,4-beta-mannosidase